MTVKQFFKSTAFKSLAVLLSIVIIAGALLAILSDLLHVSDEEKLNRVVANIYGDGASVEKTLEITEEQSQYATGTADKAYLMSDGNYLIQATGKGGYAGTITAWVVVKLKDSKLAGVGKVVYDSDKAETLMSYLKGSFYNEFSKHDQEVIDGAMFWGGGLADKPNADALIENPVNGASKSANAVCNAVNTSILFIKSVVLGEEIVSSPYEYADFIDEKASNIVGDLATKTVTYSLKMKAYGESGTPTLTVVVKDGKIESFTTPNPADDPLTTGGFGMSPEDFLEKIDPSLIDGSFFIGKSLEQLESLLNAETGAITNNELAELELTTGASKSSSILIRAAVFALKNYETVLYTVKYGDWIETDSHTVSDAAITYSLKMKAYGESGAPTLTVVVKDGKIESFTTPDPADDPLTTGGFGMSPEDFLEKIDPSLIDGSFFIGKSLEQLESLLNAETGAITNNELAELELTTGASKSSSILIRAAVYALANYQVFLAQGGTQA